ncbi:MAG TPA: hypothetical protein VK674_04460 [Candidatus Limnocylindria bacterium]|nr:hypothetical protein [Candidatus Limnocylindria bacterium]
MAAGAVLVASGAVAGCSDDDGNADPTATTTTTIEAGPGVVVDSSLQGFIDGDDWEYRSVDYDEVCDGGASFEGVVDKVQVELMVDGNALKDQKDIGLLWAEDDYAEFGRLSGGTFNPYPDAQGQQHFLATVGAEDVCFTVAAGNGRDFIPTEAAPVSEAVPGLPEF